MPRQRGPGALWLCAAVAAAAAGCVMGQGGGEKFGPREGWGHLWSGTYKGEAMPLKDIKTGPARYMPRVGPRDHASLIPSFPTNPQGHPRAGPELETVEETPSGAPHAICSPALFEVNEAADPIKNARYGWGSMKAQDVLRHVLSSLSVPSFATLPLQPFHNVDGRIHDPVIGTMGGDVGEFLLALNVFEQYTADLLTDRQVLLMMRDYLLYTDIPAFIFQVDSEMEQQLCDTAQCCGQDCLLDHPGPPPHKVEEVLKAIVEAISSPSSQTSTYFKHLLKNHEEYQTRRELTKYVIRAYFRLLWEQQQPDPLFVGNPTTEWMTGSKLKLLVLNDDHHETALLHVRTAACHPSRIPMIRPLNEAGSLLVMHDDAAQMRRHYNAEWLVQQAYGMGLPRREAYDADLLASAMDEVAGKQYFAALQHHNGATPIFSLNYPAACCN